MIEKTIAIIEFIHYDGKHTSKDHMYFETKLRAERYLKGNGYEPDDISEWKKDYVYSAKIHMETLHLGDGEEWHIIDIKPKPTLNKSKDFDEWWERKKWKEQTQHLGNRTWKWW